MSWSAKIMPDDQVDPASLVGRIMGKGQQIDRIEWETADGIASLEGTFTIEPAGTQDERLTMKLPFSGEEP